MQYSLVINYLTGLNYEILEIFKTNRLKKGDRSPPFLAVCVPENNKGVIYNWRCHHWSYYLKVCIWDAQVIAFLKYMYPLPNTLNGKV